MSRSEAKWRKRGKGKTYSYRIKGGRKSGKGQGKGETFTFRDAGRNILNCFFAKIRVIGREIRDISRTNPGLRHYPSHLFLLRTKSCCSE